MSTVACIINDFLVNRRIFLVFAEDEFARVNAFWESEDKLLRDLQANAVFAGRTRWCDLEAHHFGYLIMKNLSYVAALSADEQSDDTHATIRSLHFLLMAMVRCIETRARSMVEMLTINRIAEIEVSFSYHAAINMALEIAAPKDTTENHLRVIVDNTRTDD